VPHWVRGEESARIVAPAEHTLSILGLGGSVGTPEGGVTAEVVVVDGLDSLEALGDGARGKIVLFNGKMEKGFGTENGYGALSSVRAKGASAAAKHGLRPRRTIRAILYTNEENGLRGGKDYAKRYEKQMPNHVAAIESDLGAAPPIGFGVTAGEGAVAVVSEIAALLAVVGADQVFPGGGGADISPMKKFGVPQIGQYPDPDSYFDYHHTEADTLDKVDRQDLDRNVAAMALMAYMLADLDEPLPRIELESAE